MKESRYNVWVEQSNAAYVYNGVSGALLEMPLGDRRALELLLSGRVHSGCSTELVRELTLGRMLVADDADELALLEARYASTRHDQSSFALTIVTSLGCNFDCPYCFEAKHPSILDDDVERAILAMLDDHLDHITHFDVGWFGGEPLVGKRPLLRLSDEFISRCDAANVVYDADIRTNGYLLSAETCRELHDRRVTTLQVTLDGPPDVHDVMRPVAGETNKGSFWRIIDNLHHAIECFDVRVHVNVDTVNIARLGELFQILADEGFAGRVTIYAAQLLDETDNHLAPANSYGTRGFTISEFASAEIEFDRLARSFGLGDPSLPRPIGAPCPAIRANEFVVGSEGELYKCLGSVGSAFDVIGNVKDYANPNGRLRRWMAYNPFSDDECRSCIALPVCMGGCAQQGMQLDRRENRCDAFRFNYRQRVLDFVDVPVALGHKPARAASAASQR